MPDDLRHPEFLTEQLAPQGFVPFDGWRRDATAYCPTCTPAREASGDEATYPTYRVVAYRNPDPIHDGVTWDWREYGLCTGCEREWRLLAHDRES